MAKLLLRNIRAGKRQLALADLDSIMRKEIEKTIDSKIKPALLVRHKNVVADWNTQIDFQARKFVQAAQIFINVFPTGKNRLIYIYVDQGTKPHPIEPKTKKALSFQWGGKGSYKPKTMAGNPGRVASGGGKVVGGEQVVFKRIKNHPGTKARNLSKLIAEDVKKQFQREIDNAFRRIARRVEK